MVLVACAQMCSTEDVAHNLAVSVKLARDAAAAGAKALFLPEAADYIANDAHMVYLLAEPLATHTYTLGLQAAAKELGISINAGIHERPGPDEATAEEPGSERVFNTHVSIGPDGNIKSVYRKLHLFDIQLKEPVQGIHGEKSPTRRTGEHQRIIPGSALPDLIDMGAIGRVGPEICYDIRFPELHLILRRKGADIITIPSAFTVPTGRAHWHTLVRSVAISYQVYVIAAAQAGAHSSARSSWGEALVFDPWGVELGRLPSIDEAGDPTQPMPPQFLLVDVDPARVESVREQVPLAIQKRDDIYSLVEKSSGSTTNAAFAKHIPQPVFEYRSETSGPSVVNATPSNAYSLTIKCKVVQSNAPERQMLEVHQPSRRQYRSWISAGPANLQSRSVDHDFRDRPDWRTRAMIARLGREWQKGPGPYVSSTACALARRRMLPVGNGLGASMILVLAALVQWASKSPTSSSVRRFTVVTY